MNCHMRDACIAAVTLCPCVLRGHLPSLGSTPETILDPVFAALPTSCSSYVTLRAETGPTCYQSLAAADAPASMGSAPEMTVESVDAALDKVRPYLIADGGNVGVVDVSNGMVELQLQVGMSEVLFNT